MALLTTAVQTKAEPPKGLAADNDGSESAAATTDKPGETETDNSSAALASVRATLA